MSEAFADFPKLYSPLVREMGKIVQPYAVAEGFEWALQPGVTAYEKLDGTNVGVRFDAEGQVERIQNRRTLIWDAHTPAEAPLNGWANRIYLAVMKRYNGQKKGPPLSVVYGECIGPKVNTNRHGLREAIWVPFNQIPERYGTFHFETPEAMAEFVRGAGPLFCTGYTPEGVVLYGTEPWQIAKFRKDMIP